MPANYEIELKFLCAPEQLAQVLAAAPAGADESHELISVYFDTPGLDLQKAGASLRVRESRGRRVQTLKRGAGVVREEHEAPIEGATPDLAMEALAALLPGGSETELKPAFNVRITRRQRLVRFDGAEIELALDQGEVRGGKAARPISEVELELKAGEPAALFGLARQLGRAAPLYLSFESKADRGQALAAGPAGPERRKEKVSLERDDSVGDAFQAIARAALHPIAANAEVLRDRDEVETVHQLRVAVRVLRSALSTFREVVGDAQFDAIRAGLRWLARDCDDARNLDVFLADTLEPGRALQPPPPGLDALAEALVSARAGAGGEVRAAVSSERFRTLLVDVAAWVETGDWLRAEAAGAPARRFAPDALDRRRRKLLATGKALLADSDETRHHLRIQAKKLRYTAEGFQSLYPKRATTRFIDRLKALQEELGALNDLATAQPLLTALALSPEAAFAAGELVGRRAGLKDAHIARAAKALHRLAEAEPFWT